MDTHEAWYRLAAAQVGARAAMRLLEVFQHPEAIFAASPRQWAGHARLNAAGCERLQAAAGRQIGEELARMARLGIQLIGLHDDAYPARLRAIADPPVALFVKGQLSPLDAQAIAIVGSRRASPYGRQVAAELAAELARRGVTVVSGMALGADASAHEGCLRAQGRTIAVLAGGVDIIYPPEHADLYERIAAAGAIVSEAPLGAPPSRYGFPLRNRIISGLSLGVVIVEAPEKSGALITAQHAAEQGREVFAVPGSVNSVQSRGSHQLLRDGAKLVESVEDILEEVRFQVAAPRPRPAPLAGPSWDQAPIEADEPPIPCAMPAPPAPRRKPRATAAAPPPEPTPIVQADPDLPPEELAVFRLLNGDARHVDELIGGTDLAAAQVNAALLMLELKGYVQRRPGNVYVRLR